MNIMTNHHLSRKLLRVLGGSVIAIFAMKGFFDTSMAYNSFRIAYGIGQNMINAAELVFYLWSFLYGTVSVIGLTVALANVSLIDSIIARLAGYINHTRVFVGIVMVFSFVGVVLFRHLILLDAPIADDESSYVFIARTLLHGRVINPAPEDAEFFRRQFIIINEHGWFGKYPIGHPLILAMGIVTRTLPILGGILAALTILATFLVAERLFGRTAASGAILLLSVSPHFIGTWATLLSQPTSTLSMLAGMYFLVRSKERYRPIWMMFAGLSLGFGILVRPFPGVLFAVAAAIWFFWPASNEFSLKWMAQKLKQSIPGIVPVVTGVFLFLLVNKIQVGGFFSSPYAVDHGDTLGFIPSLVWQRSLSIGGGLVRQSFWLVGTPLILLLLPFVRNLKSASVILIYIAAEYAYRLISPKTCVASTGPIYLTEIVPLLMMLLSRGALDLRRLGIDRLGANITRWVIAFVTATVMTSCWAFWPVQLVGLHGGAMAWKETDSMIEAANVENAVVFTPYHLHPKSLKNWAYFPPANSPDLSDSIIFIHVSDKMKMESALAFCSRRFPDRDVYAVMNGKSGRELVLIQAAKKADK